MKLQTATPINTLFDDIPTGEGKITIDHSTQRILESFLTEYRVDPKNWQQVVTSWYEDYPYVSLEDMDGSALMEFTIHFKLFLLGQLQEILDAENKAFEEYYRRRNE
jgi:hypothetical protein